MKMRDLFTWRATVSQRRYAATGLSLMLFKYAIDAVVIRVFAGTWWTPLDYLTPLMRLHQRLGTGLSLGLAVWTLPFIWIGLAMSVRRCRDAGMSVLVAACYFMPVLNYALMLVLCVVPAATPAPTVDSREPPADNQNTSLLVAASAGALGGLPLVFLATKFAAAYTSSLFFGVPFMMGAIAGRLSGRKGRDRPAWRRFALLATLTLAIAGGLILLAAVEGAVCLLMCLPIAWPALFLGVLLGWESHKNYRARLGRMMPALLLPVLILHGVAAPDRFEHAVRSDIIIDASPQKVFQHVVTFAELPPPDEWLFRLSGIAYPIRADMVGQGIGAVRRCQFTTGAFVEPITAWEPGERLAFDVIEHPPSMHEWSPYQQLQPPHVANAFLSRRGEFRMQPCGAASTCLTGTTWYTLDLAPSIYWGLWADAVVHTIHGRVLRHVKTLAEKAH